MAESIVTSVPDPSSFSAILPTSNASSNPNSTTSHNIHLDLRNHHFAIDREALIELPESILLCLFPNGVVLSQKQQNQRTRSPADPNQDHPPHDVYYVDFDGPCLSYILNFFSQARLSYYGTTTRPIEPLQLYAHIPSPLFYRQAVIVLREELEYFTIPTSAPTQHQSEHDSPLAPSSASTHNNNNKDLKSDDLLGELKKNCGDYLLTDMNIFTALQRNVERENNAAERHLIDMLCMSGFDKTDKWGYRTLEPRRCAISSLALVLLQTGITHDPPSTSESYPSETTGSSIVQMTGPSDIAKMTPQVNAAQLNTAQKLLLFWRKPARKCWWDATQIEVQLSDHQTRVVRLWARRVWTLELSLI